MGHFGSFKYFLINEDKAFLGHKIGDVLTAAQDLEDDLDNLGARQIARISDSIVNQIRKILHSNWQQNQHPHLQELQAVAVMIKKAIEEKRNKGATFDLKETIKMAIQKLEDLSTKLGQPVNQTTAPPEDAGEEMSPDDFELTGDDPAPAAEQPPADPNAQPDPNQQGQSPDMSGMQPLG